nr:hypothetical protein HK105_001000 [Polyrhizophydium stewartii]
MLADRFESVCEACPARTALLVAGETLGAAAAPAFEAVTYEQLGRSVRLLAAALTSAGVRRRSYVGVALGRCRGLVEMLLALLRLGAVYVPLPADGQDAKHASTMVAAVPGLRIVVGSPDTLDSIGVDARGEHQLGQGMSLRILPGGDDHEPAYRGRGLAYILSTSGTTRGGNGGLLVRVPHAAIATNIDEIADRLELDPDATPPPVFLLASAPTFDPSVIEMLLPLSRGASLAVVPDACVRAPGILFRCIVATGVTHLMMTPALFDTFGHGCKRAIFAGETPVRHLVFGGEAFPVALAALADEKAGPALWNIYGTTECSVWASLTRVTSPTKGKLGLTEFASIHHVLSHTHMRVDPLSVEPDDGDAASSELMLGEVWLGGTQRVCFVGDETEAVLMRPTGDLAEVNKATGEIRFVGRRDRQIKRMGYRIHLDQVASAIEAVRCVSRCHVVQAGNNTLDQTLVAFVVLHAGSTEEQALEEISAECKRALPFYSRPGKFIALDVFPTTHHGKVDFARLATIAASTPKVNRQSGGISVDAEQLLSYPDFALLRTAVWDAILDFLPACKGKAADGGDLERAYFLALGGTTISSGVIVASLKTSDQIKSSPVFDEPSGLVFCGSHDGSDNKALNDLHSRILKELMQRSDNRKCVDCRKRDPRWASWNLGVFMCIRCSGIHRSLGTHITKVKSADLDTWTPEQIENMKRWGNARANLYWEHDWPRDMDPPEGNIEQFIRANNIEQFIRAKYERKQYAMRGPIPDPESLTAPGQAAAEPAFANFASFASSPFGEFSSFQPTPQAGIGKAGASAEIPDFVGFQQTHGSAQPAGVLAQPVRDSSLDDWSAFQ